MQKNKKMKSQRLNLIINNKFYLFLFFLGGVLDSFNFKKIEILKRVEFKRIIKKLIKKFQFNLNKIRIIKN